LKQEFEAMIDTGFTGFLMMPLVSAFPLGLTLLGTSSYTLADGSSSPKLLALGTVSLDGQETSGVIVLETNQCGLLLGMAYLRAAKRTLIVSDVSVALLDQEYITKIVADATKTLEQTTAAGADTTGPRTEMSEPSET
jgi:predicted aspartyl protease